MISYAIVGPGTSRKLFEPEKPFVKLRPTNSVKLVFSYVAKGWKINITVWFRDSRRLRFEDPKKIMSREMRPKSFGTFQKRAPGVSCRKEGKKEQTGQYNAPGSINYSLRQSYLILADRLCG